ncbi:HAMP domain protein [mine drainage metagenome]|uniref:HAMP domain protein n=1 Tax=mine drainage metagenome TaxID=410659 RepID=A0A1J5QMT1_9ZZZZ
MNPLFASAKLDADKLVELQIAGAKSAFESAERSYMITITVSIGALLVGIVLGGLLGLTTVRAISRPLDRLIGLLQRIARGEFNSRVIIDRDDEIGIALRHLQAMQAKLGFDREVSRFEGVRRGRRAERTVGARRRVALADTALGAPRRRQRLPHRDDFAMAAQLVVARLHQCAPWTCAISASTTCSTACIDGVPGRSAEAM